MLSDSTTPKDASAKESTGIKSATVPVAAPKAAVTAVKPAAKPSPKPVSKTAATKSATPIAIQSGVQLDTAKLLSPKVDEVDATQRNSTTGLVSPSVPSVQAALATQAPVPQVPGSQSPAACPPFGQATIAHMLADPSPAALTPSVQALAPVQAPVQAALAPVQAPVQAAPSPTKKVHPTVLAVQTQEVPAPKVGDGSAAAKRIEPPNAAEVIGDRYAEKRAKLSHITTAMSDLVETQIREMVDFNDMHLAFKSVTEEQIKTANSTIHNLETERSALQSRIGTLETEAVRETARIKELEAKNEEAGIAIDNLTKERDMANERLVAVKRKWAIMMQEV